MIKPKIILNSDYGIHYFGDTSGFNFAEWYTDVDGRNRYD